jgi:FMN phosphatase YigB (HAD superfamily)
MKEIKHIIFDLGGVIINLNIQLTIREFNKISAIPFDQVYTQARQTELFNLFDKGQISEYDFFSELRKQIGYEGAEADLLSAWNAMLLDIPEKRLDLLVTMKQKYDTFLLSNTCEPHIRVFERDLYLRHGVKNFEDYFDRVYYSCRMGMRKPDQEIFERVLEENGLKPEQTVFIDDSAQHVKGAGACGINAYLLAPGMEVGVLLKELGLL